MSHAANYCEIAQRYLHEINKSDEKCHVRWYGVALFPSSSAAASVDIQCISLLLLIINSLANSVIV